MAKYFFHGSYTQSGIAGLLKDGGTGRRKAVEALAKSVGGGVESMYWGFGKDDFYLTCDLPDHAAAVALSASTAVSGAVTISTVVLLTAEDMDEAITRHPSYRSPGT
jgi:uncharacterized protein with GYD domain